jgi:tripartite-type tricarboxylate transporter receptor subunit TctC
MTLLSQSIVLPYVQSGKMKPLAVSSPRRSAALPDVPTVEEAGFPKAALLPWFGLVAPPGTPRDVVDKANAALRKTLATSEVKDRLEAMGAEIAAGSPDEMQQYLEKEADLLGRLIKQRNIRVN